MDQALTPQNVELSDIYDKPEVITSLLYKKLLEKLDTSIRLLTEHRYFEANRALQHCNDILTRLGFGIKYEAGVLADQLETLYRYMFDRIHEANMKKNSAIIQEVRVIVKELDDAWTTAMQKAKDARGAFPLSTDQSEVAMALPQRNIPRFNPYQQREIEQEVYEYQQHKQEVHLKK
ncbi:flagellar export chaperone FliS [Aneurinibacillus aneurinilyticus]|uniref:flagellar export chaperone FliS n=1 Tax=Aneurinibacillus aneurinilyticus TaxID=1391 RepID=UPI0023F03AFB|nr:flagellar protein FliS [Aneurinibacillus aneurinilyticus]